MNKIAISLAALAIATIGQTYSFAGDWQFDSDATLFYNTALGSGSQNDVSSNLVTATQSTVSEFTFPVNFSGFTGQGDFVVSGTTVTDINSGGTTDPFTIPFGTSTIDVRITYPTWNLTGNIDGINSGISDGFGNRAYHITGDSVTINGIQIEAFLGTWVDLGNNNSLVVNSWSLERDAVPEPASMLIISAASFLALKRKKRS